MCKYKISSGLIPINDLYFKHYNKCPQNMCWFWHGIHRNYKYIKKTFEKNFTINFYGIIEAKKFATKLTDAITGTTILKRSTEKVKEAFSTVDDVLGFNTRETIKRVIENGVVSSILKGTKKRNKNMKKFIFKNKVQ